MNIQAWFQAAPLHLAVQNNNTEVVRLLLGNGADINLTNCSSKTPLDIAPEGSEIESLLLQAQQSTP